MNNTFLSLFSQYVVCNGLKIMFLPIFFKVDMTAPICRFNNPEHIMGVYGNKTRRESGAFSEIFLTELRKSYLIMYLKFIS